MTQTATLDQLKPGHEYPGANLNARVTDREQDIDALTASIKSEGILQSLLVTHHPKGNGALYVIAGNRRLAALRKLKWDQPVPVIIREDVTPGSALAMSLAENVTQCPLHPVDRYETFAALVKGGKLEADIAASYSISERTVKQSLALGRLSPKIRQAWRKDELDARAAQAFTLAKSEKEQDHVFDRLKKTHQLSDWNIRGALVGNQQDTKRLMSVVGREAYEAAGGKMQVDLFARRPGQQLDPGEDEDDDEGDLLVSDHALLVRLAGQKIEEKCKELTAIGWAWAEDADDLPSSHSWDWKKIESPNANAPKEQKARAGCAVSIDYNGKLTVKYGLLKPGTKAAPAQNKDGAASKAPAKISNSLGQRLDAWAARATQDALQAETGGELHALLAKIVASQIQPDRINYMPEQVRKKLEAIRDAVTPKVMNEALQKRIDRQNYFSSAPKPIVLKAIKETLGEEHAKKLAGGTKAAAWKFALANVPKTWLPAELRTSHYEKPAPAAAKPAKKQTFDGSGVSVEERRAAARRAKAKPKAAAPKKKAA